MTVPETQKSDIWKEMQQKMNAIGVAQRSIERYERGGMTSGLTPKKRSQQA